MHEVGEDRDVRRDFPIMESLQLPRRELEHDDVAGFYFRQELERRDAADIAAEMRALARFLQYFIEQGRGRRLAARAGHTDDFYMLWEQ